MAEPRTLEIRIARKISQNYNSTEYAMGVTLELGPNDHVDAITADWSQKLRNSIRDEFKRQKGDKEE